VSTGPQTFEVSLLFYVKDPGLRRAIQANAGAWSAARPDPSLTQDNYAFRVFDVGDEPSLAQALIERLYQEGAPAPLVLVSDELLGASTSGAKGRLEYGAAATVVANAFLANGVPTAFIALGDFTGEPPTGLIARIPARPLAVERLQDAIGRAALRVHLLAPPRARLSRPNAALAGDGNRRRYTFHLAETPEQLLSSFELRYAIYDVMGYLSKEVVQAGTGLELDFHDGMSLHYVARAVETGEVAASVRLVFPSQPWTGEGRTVAPELRDAFQMQQSWFRKLARAIPAPALQRALLDGGAGALPMLQNARPERAWAPLVAEGLRGVELSRSIVPPRHRGGGLSRALVHLTLAAAYDLGKQAVFAECFPSHVAMYQQYGFADIEGRQATMENWGSFYYTPQALLLELSNPTRRAMARWNSALFKMANAKIQEQRDLDRCGGMEA
jgi:hypothetical protein